MIEEWETTREWLEKERDKETERIERLIDSVGEKH